MVEQFYRNSRTSRNMTISPGTIGLIVSSKLDASTAGHILYNVKFSGHRILPMYAYEITPLKKR